MRSSHGSRRERTFCVARLINSVQAEVIRLMRAYPRLVDTKKGKSGGDPFVLAQALAGDPRLVVVSEEKGGSENSPKIPYVCALEELRA